MESSFETTWIVFDSNCVNLGQKFSYSWLGKLRKLCLKNYLIGGHVKLNLPKLKVLIELHPLNFHLTTLEERLYLNILQSFDILFFGKESRVSEPLRTKRRIDLSLLLYCVTERSVMWKLCKIEDEWGTAIELSRKMYTYASIHPTSFSLYFFFSFTAQIKKSNPLGSDQAANKYFFQRCGV